MKIIVNNEREKEIIEKFAHFLGDWADDKKMEEFLEYAVYDFKPHELKLILLAFRQVEPKVDKKEYPVYLQTWDLKGVCKYCGKQWQGVEDEYEFDVVEYERNLNLSKEYSYHAECYREITCNSCGNDEAMSVSELYDSKWGLICKECHNEEKIKEESK